MLENHTMKNYVQQFSHTKSVIRNKNLLNFSLEPAERAEIATAARKHTQKQV